MQNTSAVMTTATVSDLAPFTNYSCFAFTRVNGNRGSNTTTVIQQTAEEGMGYGESTKLLLSLHCR